jgi:hypothetical protein
VRQAAGEAFETIDRALDGALAGVAEGADDLTGIDAEIAADVDAGAEGDMDRAAEVDLPVV